MRVLVVDDERDICDFIVGLLDNEGHEAVAESSPQAALDRLKQESFHLCVVDLMMPEMSGIELLSRVRKIDSDIAAIILTGFPTVESATKSIEHEVSGYLKKPIEVEEFRVLIERVARKKGLVLRKEDELHQTIGYHIRDLRKQRDLTLKQMARRTDLSVSLLSQIERAESSASVSSLFKIATALDVSITELFGNF